MFSRKRQREEYIANKQREADRRNRAELRRILDREDAEYRKMLREEREQDVRRIKGYLKRQAEYERNRRNR